MWAWRPRPTARRRSRGAGGCCTICLSFRLGSFGRGGIHQYSKYFVYNAKEKPYKMGNFNWQYEAVNPVPSRERGEEEEEEGKRQGFVSPHNKSGLLSIVRSLATTVFPPNSSSSSFHLFFLGRSSSPSSAGPCPWALFLLRSLSHRPSSSSPSFPLRANCTLGVSDLGSASSQGGSFQDPTVRQGTMDGTADRVLDPACRSAADKKLDLLSRGEGKLEQEEDTCPARFPALSFVHCRLTFMQRNES